MVNVAVVGCGYWGPNLIRNFVTCPDTELLWACDKDETRLRAVLGAYPSVRATTRLDEILADERVDAVAAATPVQTHFPIAESCLAAGKHVLVEKPLAISVDEGERLVAMARDRGLQLMCDHTFCYTGAVRKIKEIIDSGELGELLYFDSVRVNLGLFQSDINVIWDLAPHDLSILDFLMVRKPSFVSAHGVCHAGNDLENIAYLTLGYESDFISHIHVNWLSPVKIRKTIIGGSDRMLVWNDLEGDEKIKVYDKGIRLDVGSEETRREVLVSYRSGDIHVPRVEHTEALAVMVREFVDAIEENRPALTDGEAGLRVLRILDAAQRSIRDNGRNVRLTDG